MTRKTADTIAANINLRHGWFAKVWECKGVLRIYVKLYNNPLGYIDANTLADCSGIRGYQRINIKKMVLKAISKEK